MIIAEILKFGAGKVLALATTTEDNPKKSNWISLIGAGLGLLGISDDTRASVADTLMAVAELLKGF